MTSELAGPMYCGNDVEHFCSEKVCYILFPVDGTSLLSETVFEKLVSSIVVNKSCAKTLGVQLNQTWVLLETIFKSNALALS